MGYTHVLAGLAGAVGVAVAGLGPAPAGPDQSAEPLEREVVARFHDGAGKAVVLRRGTYDRAGRGWGWSRIVGRHAVTDLHVVGAVLGRSGGRVVEGDPDRVVYRALLVHGEVTVPMTMVADEESGVLTAYCDLDDPSRPRCPAWVNDGDLQVVPPPRGTPPTHGEPDRRR